MTAEPTSFFLRALSVIGAVVALGGGCNPPPAAAPLPPTPPPDPATCQGGHPKQVVQCDAPVAVQQKLTTDGLNLAQVPAAAKGVTCFFCHSAASVDGTHNDPLTLAADGESLFGPFSDPVPGSPHKVSHSNLLDDLRPESAAACGSCHDIVNGHGPPIERTFQE